MTGEDTDTGAVLSAHRFRRTVFWLALWLVVQGVAVSYGLWLGHHNDQEHVRLVEAEQAEDDIEEAVRCVDSWGIAVESRNSDEFVYRRLTATLIEASSNLTPERLTFFHELIERDVAEIRGATDNPACDIEASRRLLGG